jgi:hypothetical protein
VRWPDDPSQIVVDAYLAGVVGILEQLAEAFLREEATVLASVPDQAHTDVKTMPVRDRRSTPAIPGTCIGDNASQFAAQASARGAVNAALLDLR